MADDKRKSLLKRFLEFETPPSDADTPWYARRGKALEDILYQLLELEELEPRRSFRPKGEELDGSFVLDGRVFLVEAKWKSRVMAASDLYQLSAKVAGKLVGTLGVFFSISGYSRDAGDALVMGKRCEVILFTGGDLKVILEGEKTLKEGLRLKLRAAAETGLPLLELRPTAKIVKGTRKRRRQTPAPSSIGPLAHFGTDLDDIFGDTLPAERVDVVVESDAERDALLNLLPRLVSETSVDFRLWVSGGPINLANLLMAMFTDRQQRRVAVIMDADQPAARSRIDALADREDLVVVTATPDVQTWLRMAAPDLHPDTKLADVAVKADLDRLERTAEGWTELKRLLTKRI
jgi:hypothetical protein